MKVLHVAAEVFPLVKTGGLADVVGALPQALQRSGADVRLLLPGPAGDRRRGAAPAKRGVRASAPVFGAGARHAAARRSMPYSHLPVYVVDAPLALPPRRQPLPGQPTAASGPTTCSASRCSAGSARTWPPASSTRAGRPTCCTPTTGTPRWPAPTWTRTRRRRTAIGLHRPQPGLPGAVPAGRLRRCSACRRASCRRRARVPRPAVVHEGRAEVRRPRHHRQPDLCARDRHATSSAVGLDGVIRGRGARRVAASSTASTATVWNPATDTALAGALRRRAARRQGALQGRRCRPSSAWTSTPRRRCSASSAG